MGSSLGDWSLLRDGGTVWLVLRLFLDGTGRIWVVPIPESLQNLDQFVVALVDV